MKTYIFKIELEADEEGWRAFCPPLEEIGASTWGESTEQALKNIQEVLALIVQEFAEEGRPIPGEEHLRVSEETLVTVNR